jgi:glycosyltransferase involved in cell wall biosynthesis
MNEGPKILVAICNYNHSKYLEASVRSIMVQSYQNLDICVIDDGSDDQERVREIVDQLKIEDQRIRYIELAENRGKWWCLNEAIKTTDAPICTSHDADDISLRHRIERQLRVMSQTRTVHNLCGFYHCWSEEDVIRYAKIDENKDQDDEIKVIGPDTVNEMVMTGFQTPGVNHYSTGNFETAGVSAMFYKGIWQLGLRFNPPNKGLRTLVSEDSDFNFRVTAMLKNTSILAEPIYCYRRNTSTNSEEV